MVTARRFSTVNPKASGAQAARRERERVEAWQAEERERIRRQRIYLETLKGTFRDALVQKMLERAEHLYDAGMAEACDALLEFVPEAQATAFLDRMWNETFPEDERAS